MKRMRKILWVALIALVTAGLLAGCAETEDALRDGGAIGPFPSDGIGGATYGKSSSVAGDAYVEEIAGEGEAGPETGAGDEANETQPSSGLMTAIAWDDNQYYNEWKALFAQASENEQEGGRFNSYLTDSWWLDTLHRVKVTVKTGEEWMREGFDFPIPESPKAAILIYRAV